MRRKGHPNYDHRAGFDTFWYLYPRKIKQDAACRAWMSLVDDAKTEAGVLAGLRLWLSSSEWTDPKFILTPDRWLFEKRWQDTPRPASDDLPGFAKTKLKRRR